MDSITKLSPLCLETKAKCGPKVRVDDSKYLTTTRLPSASLIHGLADAAERQ